LLGSLAFGLSCAAGAQTTPGATTGGAAPRPGQPADDFSRQLGRDRPSAASRDAGTRSEPLWSFGVLNRLTVSDNIGLEPPGQEDDGFLLEVSPYVRADINRPRLQAELAYAMRNFYTSPDEGYEGPNHDLRAFGNAALKDDWFWLAGQALVYQVSDSPFEATAADPSSRSGNRSRYSRYDISPYVRGWIGEQTSYEAGYGFNAIRYGRDETSSTANLLRARVESNPVLRRFGWLVNGDTSRREFDNGADYNTSNALFAGLYRLTRSLRIGAGASYTRINVVSNADGETGGWGPAALLTWTPTPRTSLHLEATHAYYGNAAAARLSHRAQHWTLGLQYDQGIVDGSEAGVTYLDSRTQPRTGQGQESTPALNDELADRGTLPGFGTPLASGLLAGALVERRRLAVTAGWLRQRNSVGITIFKSRSETRQTTVPLPGAVGGFTELDQDGILAQYDRLLTPRTTATLQGRLTRSETAGGSISSDLRVLEAVLTHTYSRQTTASIGYRRADQDGSSEYRENAVIATLNFRF
jgi:uncharacterized protein (PEP-CTERM system associated)